MPETVTFNVGGRIHQLSRSLLDLHPDTLLAKCASKRWQKDPNSEIFLERDGDLFSFVLRYLRDGKVALPLTVPKESILHELEYYAIDVVDHEETIYATRFIKPVRDVNTMLTGIKRVHEDLERLEQKLEEEKIQLLYKHERKKMHITIAKLCIDAWMRNDIQHILLQEGTKEDYSLCVTASDGVLPYTVFENYRDSIIACNDQLHKVGLEISIMEPIDRHLSVRVKVMRSIQKLVVAGAGTDAVNGVYEASGCYNDVGMYSKRGIWDGQDRVFTIDFSNGRWYLGVVPKDGYPGVRVDLFYSASAYQQPKSASTRGRRRSACGNYDQVEEEEFPLNLRWLKMRSGEDPSPSISIHGNNDVRSMMMMDC